MRALLLILSITANLAIGAWLWRHDLSLPPPHAASPPQLLPSAAETRLGRLAVGGEGKQLQKLAVSPDLVRLMRAEGFPDWAIHTFLLDRVRPRYAEQVARLSRESEVRPYWRSDRYGNQTYSERAMAERRRIWTAMRTEITTVMDAGGASSPDVSSPDARRRYGNLPAEKIAAIEGITGDYAELIAQVREESKGLTLPEDREKLAYLEKERRADLEKILTPDELDQYDRRTSPSAMAVRMQLRNLKTNEDEFLKLYRLQKAFDEKYGSGTLNAEQSRTKDEARPQLTAQFREALGPARFEEFEIATHNNYTRTLSTVESLKLPKSAAADLIKVQRAATNYVTELRNDKSLSREALAEKLTEHEVRTVEQLLSTLGSDEALKRYRSSAGDWLQRLAPPSPPKKKPTS